jgi:hypothetical protein
MLPLPQVISIVMGVEAEAGGDDVVIRAADTVLQPVTVPLKAELEQALNMD